MNRFQKTLTAVALASATQWTWAETYVLGVSPHQTTPALQRQIMAISRFTTTLEAGDHVSLYDAASSTHLGTITLPDTGKREASWKEIAKRNRAGVSGLMGLLKSSKATVGGVNGRVNLPTFLRTVARNHQSTAETPLKVLVVGALRFDSAAQDLQAFSMAEGAFPSDGYLALSPLESPYGVKGLEDRLSGLSVSMVYPADELADQPRERDYIKRFWHLFIAEQGGEVASISHDLGFTLERWKSSDTLLPVPEKTDSNKAEMIHLPPVQLQQGIFKRDLSQAPLSAARIQAAENVMVAISWDCACDLDLYVQAAPDKPVLYYGAPKTADGRYWKDYQHSPRASRGFETVSLYHPVDLRALQVVINLHSRTEGKGMVNGELRIGVGDQTYAVPFRFIGDYGNRGGDLLHWLQQDKPRPRRDAYHVVNPLSVVAVSM